MEPVFGLIIYPQRTCTKNIRSGGKTRCLSAARLGDIVLPKNVRMYVRMYVCMYACIYLPSKIQINVLIFPLTLMQYENQRFMEQ